VGVGGLTLHTKSEPNINHHEEAVYVMQLKQPVFNGTSPFPTTIKTLTLDNNDTYFNFSYGGGLKAQRLWGPMGLRIDLRGRTMPNFHTQSITGFEATGGLLFSWGEK
jgi:hypothetical protein